VAAVDDAGLRIDLNGERAAVILGIGRGAKPGPQDLAGSLQPLIAQWSEATPIAVRPHWVPSNLRSYSWPNSTRRLPAHSIVRTMETSGK
jgi:hypothetical protein